MWLPWGRVPPRQPHPVMTRVLSGLLSDSPQSSGQGCKTNNCGCRRDETRNSCNPYICQYQDDEVENMNANEKESDIEGMESESEESNSDE